MWLSRREINYRTVVLLLPKRKRKQSIPGYSYLIFSWSLDTSLGIEKLHKKERLRTCIRQGIGKRHSLLTLLKNTKFSSILHLLSIKNEEQWHPLQDPWEYPKNIKDSIIVITIIITKIIVCTYYILYVILYFKSLELPYIWHYYYSHYTNEDYQN